MFFLIALVFVLVHIVLRMTRFSDNPFEFYREGRKVILFDLLVFAGINFRLFFRDNEVNRCRVTGYVYDYLPVALMGSFGFELMQL